MVRQVCHSPNNPKEELDLVLFLNGIPVATVELKGDFTQSVQDAVDQCRFDRHPQPKGGVLEPLLGFPGGALVHFAVSQSEVMMTTRLAGPATSFLPFNRGNAGGAGNAPNPEGFATNYLWEEVWARESWLDILHRYLIGKRDDKKQLKSLIFPRYHQLDATRRLAADVLAQGAGQRYLIQHSAGSGKTNSIAWTAHFLADLHDAEHKKMFDSVLVVSDRNVLDAQFCRKPSSTSSAPPAWWPASPASRAARAAQLGQALKDGKKIIVCTIQTVGCTEHLHDAHEQPVGAGTHVDRLSGEPHRVDADHRSSSRIQAAHSTAALAGQVTVDGGLCRAAGSMWMSASGAGVAGVGKVNGTNNVFDAGALATGTEAVPTTSVAGFICASCTHRRRRLALMPLDIATAAIDMPGCMQAATALALNSSLCLRRRRRVPGC